MNELPWNITCHRGKKCHLIELTTKRHDGLRLFINAFHNVF